MIKKFAAMLLVLIVLDLPLAFCITIIPSSISADSIQDNSATVVWQTDIPGEGEVWYGTDANVRGRIPYTGGPSTQYSVPLSGLDQGQRYFYRIFAYEPLAPVNDDLSSYKEFTTLLSSPSGLSASEITHSQLKLSWNANAKAAKYKVYRDGAYLSESTAASFTVTGLAADTGYTFEVVAVDSQGRDSAKSSPLQAKTGLQAVSISFVQAGSITQSSAVISWKTDRSAACTVRYGKGASLDKSASAAAATEHSKSLTGLERGTLYYYEIECEESSSARQSFTTLSEEPQLTISNVQAVDVTQNSARIVWETSIEAGSIVRYGLDDTFSQTASAAGSRMSHSVALTGLDAGATYYFKAESDGLVSEYQTFVTGESESDFIRLDAVPELTRNHTITVSGQARERSRIYIFVNSNDVAQVRQQIEGTGFSFSVMLDPGRSYDGVRGRNYVEINAWDLQGNKDTKGFYVVVDNTPPALTVDSVPEFTMLNRLDITGSTEADAAVEFFVNGRGQGQFKPEADGSFKHTLNLGSDGKYNVSIVSTDPAGNEKRLEYKVTIDRKVPSLEILTDFSGETHFKLFKVKGKTEPHATVTVTNFGEYSGCPDAKLKTDYGGCENFVYKQDKYDKWITLIDPVSYGLGMQIEVEADKDGEFVVSVPLIQKAGQQLSVNNLHFNATGRNGLWKPLMKSIRYRPGCSDWTLGRMESYPFNIYTRELNEGEIVASAFFPIRYTGSGTPKVTQIRIDKYQGNVGYLMSGENEMRELIEVGSGRKASPYDEKDKEIYVYAPIRIKRYTGSLDKLPDQLNAFLMVQLTYGVDGSSATCELYPVAAFDVHKPELLSKWLSPTMINNTIKKLDVMINHTKAMVKHLRTASMIGLVACGAMIAYNYLQGFFVQAEDKEDGECTEAEANMEYTYWVCDRILCPAVPPRCNDFTSHPTLDNHYIMERDSETLHLQYYSVENGRVVGDISQWTTTQQDGRTVVNVQLQNEFNSQARLCASGTLVVVSRTGMQDRLSIFRPGTEIQQVEVKCVQGISPDDMGHPVAEDIAGCYDSRCPRFDNTKCFTRDNIEPPGGLWSSAVCACLPGLMSHLRNWLQIMEGAKKCLQQAQIGEVRGGFCERLLAQFVCDLLIEAFRMAMGFLSSPIPGAEGGAEATGLRGAVTNYKSHSKQLSDSLSSRYGDIVKNKVGLSSDQLVNRACVVAFTGDWSLLDGVLENIVEAVEVEPIAYITAESRPYGYDPFTGRMNIGYNIYVGVVPGGETEVKVWLECDRSYPNSEYCGTTVPVKDLPGVERHLRKSSPPINRNVVFTDQNAIYWYNKVVMELRYQISGKERVETKTAEIWKKGDLSASCHFSATNGIFCDVFKTLAPMGIVELYPAGAGTRLSPANVPAYRDGEPVSALVKIRNAYLEPFFIVVQYPDARPPVQYRVEPAGDEAGGYAAEQLYNLWIDTASSVGTGSTARTNGQWTWFSNTRRNGDIKIRVDDNLVTSMKVQLLPELNQGQATTIECKVPSRTEMDKSAKDEIYGRKNQASSDRYGSDGYYTCIFQDELFGGFSGSNIQGIQSMVFSEIVWKDPRFERTFEKMTVEFQGLDVQSHELTKEGLGTGSIQTRTVSINVYADTSENERADTPIALSGAGGDQTVELTYKVGSTTDLKPRVEIVEPTGLYFNIDDEIPIGANVWNADTVTILFQSRDKNVHYECEISQCTGIITKSLRTTYGSSTAPSFVEWLIKPEEAWPKGPTDIYDVRVTVNNKEGEAHEQKAFSFDPQNKLKKEQIMVCMGSGACSSDWLVPEQIDASSLGQFTSTAPVVR